MKRKFEVGVIIMIIAVLIIGGVVMTIVAQSFQNELNEKFEFINKKLQVVTRDLKSVEDLTKEIQLIHNKQIQEIEKKLKDLTEKFEKRISSIDQRILKLEKEDGKYDYTWELFDAKKTSLDKILPSVVVLQTELKLKIPKRDRRGNVLKDEEGNIIKEETTLKRWSGGIVIGKYVITFDSFFKWGTRIIEDPKTLPPEIEIVEPEKTYLIGMDYIPLIRVDDPLKDDNVLVENKLAIFRIPEELPPPEAFPFELGDSKKIKEGNLVWIVEYTFIGKIGRPGRVISLTPTDVLKSIGLNKNFIMYSAVIYPGFIPGGAAIAFLDGEPQLIGMVTTQFTVMKINVIERLVKEETGIDLRKQ